MAKKYFVVKIGKKEGIYDTWDECKKQVTGVSGAVYKSFKNLEDAELYFKNGEIIENKFNIDNDIDNDYLLGWHCNIAMWLNDNCDITEYNQRNNLANEFIKKFF